MTWDEFKKWVDDQLAKGGHDGTIPVEMIKFHSTGHSRPEIFVEVHEPALQVWNH